MTIPTNRLLGAARRPRDARGSMAVELVLLAPVLMAFVMLIVAFGRYVAVRGDVEAAARDAVRAASLEADHGSAVAVATGTARAGLDDDTRCTSVRLEGAWAPSSTAVVRMRCSVSMSGLGLIGLPGSISVDAESAAPLDPYRRYVP